MKVTNYDKSGKIIKDMSKVVLPEEMQKELIRIYYQPKEKAQLVGRSARKEVWSIG